MYASNSALLNALAQQKINFEQVLRFIEARYDFSPTAFDNGTQKNAESENQGSCKVFSFAQLNNLNQLDTLALFAEHYHAVRDNPQGTDHQNIRQFIRHGWQGIHFTGQALTPKNNINEINQKVAQMYAAGESEFAEITQVDNPQPTENQPGAVPTPNPGSDELVETTQNLTEPADLKNADGNIDEAVQAAPEPMIQPEPVVKPEPITESAPVVELAPVVEPTIDAAIQPSSQTTPTEDAGHNRLDEKAALAIAAAQLANSGQPVIPAAAGSSNGLNSETTYYHNNDSVTEGTASIVLDTPDSESTQDDSVAEATENNESKGSSLSVKDNTSQPTENHQSANFQDNQAGTSASELVQTNANHIADNPAAFIEDDNSSTLASKPASTPTKDTATVQTESTPITQPEVVDSTSTLGSASASDIVHSNTAHHANNPTAFIEEENTATDSSEPATTDSQTTEQLADNKKM